ncbi:hypothetical protein J8L84_01655 [Alteromonas sp. MMG017]|uniref:hypothetical protein n=1 Tax=Alteromonas sp. MMG017 TaxID=2822692 RepID=UPI001B39FAD0|nr:hypothetical protein [Alteromonas sp. MMG017]MBQ4827980.1 hypothetical protein [Alteromonas sp. MMG017]
MNIDRAQSPNSAIHTTIAQTTGENKPKDNSSFSGVIVHESEIVDTSSQHKIQQLEELKSDIASDSGLNENDRGALLSQLEEQILKQYAKSSEDKDEKIKADSAQSQAERTLKQLEIAYSSETNKPNRNQSFSEKV